MHYIILEDHTQYSNNQSNAEVISLVVFLTALKETNNFQEQRKKWKLAK